MHKPKPNLIVNTQTKRELKKLQQKMIASIFLSLDFTSILSFQKSSKEEEKEGRKICWCWNSWWKWWLMLTEVWNVGHCDLILRSATSLRLGHFDEIDSANIYHHSYMVVTTWHGVLWHVLLLGHLCSNYLYKNGTYDYS